MTNENSMFLGYSNDFIYEHVRNTDFANASDIHPYYLEQLDILWNGWLEKKYNDITTLQTAWSLGEEPLIGSNVLLNGGFEINVDPWSINKGAGWDISTALDYSTYTEGSSSLRISINDIPHGELTSLNLTQSGSSFTPNEHYYLTFWAKANQFGTKIQPLSTIGDWIFGPDIYVGTEWRKYYCTLKSTWSQGKIVFTLDNLPPGTILWLDDVQLHQGGVFGLRAEESLDDNSISRIRYSLRHSYTWDRFKDEMDFYTSIDYHYGFQMYDYLRSIGVKTPLTLTNGYYGFASIPARFNTSDYFDSHAYWDPPYAHDYTWGSHYVQVQDGGIIPDMMTLGFKNKPLTVSEWNFLFPQPTQYQGPIMMSSYSAFQDVDALILFDYYWNSSEIDLRANFIPGEYSISRNPAMMLQSLVSARLFLRDVTPAKSMILLNFTIDDIYKNMNLSTGYVPTYYPYNLDKNLYHIHGLRMTITDLGDIDFKQVDLSKENYLFSDDISVLAPPYVSDTNEIIWDPLTGIFYVNTSKTKTVLGFLEGTAITVGNLALEMTTEHCSVSLLALDDQPTELSRHLLLVSQSSNRNHDMNLNYDGQIPKPWLAGTWGTNPSEILLPLGEVKITLNNIADVTTDKISIFALNEIGERTTEIDFSIVYSLCDQLELTFNIGSDYTPCYEIIIGEIPQAIISNISPSPPIINEIIQLSGQVFSNYTIERYIWGIRYHGQPIKRNSIQLPSKSSYLNLKQIYIPQNLEEAYSIFSNEQNPTLILNSIGLYQIYFKAKASNGIWSTTVIDSFNVVSFDRKPYQTLAWSIILSFIGLGLMIVVIFWIRNKRR